MLLLFALACAKSTASPTVQLEDDHAIAPVPAAAPGQAVAVFAGGCFWCMETDFDKLSGVVSTTSGFAWGQVPNPTYEQVGLGVTGHTESVQVIYDTSKLTYPQVLDYFWHHIDPTDGGGQFCDRGDQYRSAIFPVDEAQKADAEKSKADLEASHVLPGPIETQILPQQKFYAAEIYHQDFHVKDPERYEPYRMGCGRDARVKEVWANAPH
jgi:peptide-methionine (S)-S-oxide reductase